MKKIGGFFFGICILLFLGGNVMNRNQNVGKFEDLTITQTEFHMQIKNHLANVKNRYKNEQITGSLAENKKAIEELQTASWERAIWDKAIFFIAKKEGIGDFTSYAEIVNTMADENKQREEKISKGEIVYGLSRFGLNEFYGHRLAETKTSLIKKLSQKNGPLFCSDQDVYTRFQTNKEEWVRAGTNYRLTKVSLPKDSKEYSLFQNSEYPSPEECLKHTPEAKQNEEYISLAEVQSLNAYQQEKMNKIADLQVGACSALIDNGANVYFYRLEEIIVNEDEALEKNYEKIKQTIINEKFEAYVQSVISSSRTTKSERRLKEAILQVI